MIVIKTMITATTTNNNHNNITQSLTSDYSAAGITMTWTMKFTLLWNGETMTIIKDDDGSDLFGPNLSPLPNRSSYSPDDPIGQGTERN